MKQRIISFFVCLILLASLPAQIFASEPLVPIIDIADLFNDEEYAALEEKALQIRADFGMDIVILTVDSLDGKSPQEYADDYYDGLGYGIGPDDSGVLFMISMEYRDWWISTCGDAIYALTDYGIEQIFSQMAGYLSQDDFYNAFVVYLDALPAYFEAYQNEDPIDGSAGYYDGPGSYGPGISQDIIYYEPEPDLVKIIGISLLIGVVIALVVVLIMASTMNTKKQQNNAGVYLKQNSYRLLTHRDLFLYSQLHRTRRAENNHSGGRGGSSVHRSSGGGRHGGGGGKF